MRAALLVGSGVILWVIGWLNDSYAAYMMSSASVALLLLCYAWARLSARGFSCRAQTPSHATEGQPVSLHWHADNNSRFARSLLVTLTADNLTTEEPFASQRVIELAPRLSGQTLTEQITFPARGSYTIPQGQVYTGDPLGVFSAARRFDGPGEMLVYPAVEQLPRSDWHGLSEFRSSELRATLVPTDTGEYYGIRSYQWGDDLRRIHWKATAHTGTLAVKEFEQRSSPCHIVAVELARSAHRGIGSGSSLEAAVRAAASISSHALGLGRSVGLVAIGSQRLVVAPDRGHKQFIHIMETLAVVKADGDAPLAQQIAAGAVPLPSGSTMVILASSCAPSLVHAVCSLRTRGIRGVVILVAAHTFDVSRRPEESQEEASFQSMLAGLAGCTTAYPLRHGQTLASVLAGVRLWL